MLITRSITATSFLLALAAATKGQNILYQHNFAGEATTPLHRLAVDVDNNGGGNTWTTRTDTGLPVGTGLKYTADGAIDAALPGSGAASLGFSPVAGNIYTFNASFGAIPSGAADNWIGMGFSAGQATGSGAGAEFYGNGSPTHITGQPWMIYRNPNTSFGDQTFLGPGVDGGEFWPTPVTATHGDPVDLRIVLDTTTPQWSAEWLAKNPSDDTYTSLRTTTYTTNPNIRAVAVTALDTVGGSLTSFSLTTSGSVYEAGDTDGNGVADLVDYDTIRNNFFEPLLGPTNGDLNNNGIVDYVDFRVWKDNATPGALAALGIPEPTAVLLSVTGFVLLAPLTARRRGC